MMGGKRSMKMETIRKHGETLLIMVSVVGSILTSTLWLNSKFNELEKDILVIKTVLVMKNIMPSEIANRE